MHLGEGIMEHAQILGGVTGEVIRLQSFFFFNKTGDKVFIYGIPFVIFET